MTPVITPAAYRHLVHLAVVTHPDDAYYSLREPRRELDPLLTVALFAVAAAADALVRYVVMWVWEE